jgi:hypothetical protein
VLADAQESDRHQRASAKPARPYRSGAIGRDSVSLIEWAQVIDRYEKGVAVWEMEWIDFGPRSLRADVLDLVPPRSTTSLSSMASWWRELVGYETTERSHEIGTPAEEMARFRARLQSL